MITPGSNIRITVGTQQVYARVTRVIERGQADGTFDPKRDAEYWDLEYEIISGGRPKATVGRWKQLVDGGSVQLA